jgi:ubiquinone biosynthesis protein
MGLALSDVNVGRVLIEATKIATKYNIKVPGDWMLVFKAILTIEGMGRTLDPEFDLMSMGQDLVKDLVKNQYSVQRLSKEMMWVAKDLASLMKVLPRQVRWMFRKLNSNDFAFEIKSPDFEAIRSQLDTNGQRSSLSVITVGLFIASSIAMSHTPDSELREYSVPAVTFFIGGCLFLVIFILKLIRNK